MLLALIVALEIAMFHDIPAAVRARMEQLVQMDAGEREEKLSMYEMLRQVPEETGRFLALLTATAPAGLHIEIGTSGGYSTMWLALACRAKGCKLRTYEVLEPKVKLARETLRLAGLEDVVESIHADARQQLATLSDIAFCFLDAEKDVYAECYELVVPRMVKGGLLIADNATSHAKDLKPMIDRALGDVRVDAVVVPIRNGELVCRRV